MKQIYANNFTTLVLGHQGENLARQVVFDLSAWEAEYGNGVVELIFQRNRNDTPYPVATERDGNKVVWSVTAADTEYHGNNGRCELRYYVYDVLVKSHVWATNVTPSISTPAADKPPAPEHGWVEQVLAAGAEAKQAADRAENAVVHAPIIGKNGNWFVWDSTTTEYIDTGRYSGGSAPYIGANGNWFIGTEDSGVSATGPQGPAGVDGKPGRDGVDGKDGLPGEKGDPFRYEDFTPEQLEALRGPEGPVGQPGRDGIDGKDGKDGYTPQKGIDYFDGKDGVDGVNGKDGVDGHTPVKGVDYFTENDVQQIVNSVAEKLIVTKTAMDAIAVAGAQYYLGEQTAVSVVLPDDAKVGQMVTVSWYNGATAATLSITGTMLAFDYTPSANTRSEINALWDGTYWAVLGNEMAVPKEVKV